MIFKVKGENRQGIFLAKEKERMNKKISSQRGKVGQGIFLANERKINQG